MILPSALRTPRVISAIASSPSSTNCPATHRVPAVHTSAPSDCMLGHDLAYESHKRNFVTDMRDSAHDNDHLGPPAPGEHLAEDHLRRPAADRPALDQLKEFRQVDGSHGEFVDLLPCGIEIGCHIPHQPVAHGLRMGKEPDGLLEEPGKRLRR